MFHSNIKAKNWSLRMIMDNFQDWILQGCVERDKEEREHDLENAKDIKEEFEAEQNGIAEAEEILEGANGLEEAEEGLDNLADMGNN